jgi:hypothetical protein
MKSIISETVNDNEKLGFKGGFGIYLQEIEDLEDLEDLSGEELTRNNSWRESVITVEESFRLQC